MDNWPILSRMRAMRSRVRPLVTSCAIQDVKKGVLCQLFGGCQKAVGSHKFRSDINILLVC